MNWPATIAAFALGAVLCWFLKPRPECGTSTPIDRSAAIADSLTIVDLKAALIRRDSLDRVKDSIIANREPVYIRVHENFQALRSTGNTDAARAALSRDPVTRLGSATGGGGSGGHDTIMGGETDDR